jgi:imidazolonepropionase-like amidohydrolase
MKRYLTLGLGLVASLVTACTPDASVEGSGATLFEGARLILGDGSVIEDGAFLVSGDRIERVGGAAEVGSPAGATVVDLSGKTVMPALVDAHAHLGYEGYTGWGAQEYSRDNLIEHLERYAYYGFGAVFSAGSDPDDLALELQQAQAEGQVGGARFLFGAGMAPPGQGPNNQFLQHTVTIADQTGMTVLRGAASPEEGRDAVRDIASKGIEFVKIWVDDRGGSQEKLQPPVYRAIIEEARSRELQVVVHQQVAEDMKDLLDAGVTGFLHGRIGPMLDDRLAAQIREADAFLVPNLGLGELRRERVADDPFLQETTPASVVARLGAAFDARAGGGQAAGAAAREQALSEGFMRLVEADVDVVLGTDAGAVPDHYFGYTGHRELEIFVRLGMTPMQAIVAGTSRPAERLGLEDMGMLAPGKSASFIILDANPVEDIRNTRTISQVYLRGVQVDREGLRLGWIQGD